MRHAVPETIDGYLQQHTRWARGFNDVARDYLGDTLRDRRLPRRLRLELAMFSLGYLDRLALLMAMGLQTMPVIQIAAVFAHQRVPRSMWRRFPTIPLLFGFDVFTAVRAALDSVLNRPRVWPQRLGSVKADPFPLIPRFDIFAIRAYPTNTINSIG